MNKKIIIKMIFAIVVLLFSMKFIGEVFKLRDIEEVILKLNLFKFLIVNILLYLLYWYIRTLRWNFLLSKKLENNNFLELYKINIFAISVAVISPFQSGELIKIAMLKKRNKEIEVKWMMGVFLIEKIQDLLVLFFAFFIGLYFIDQFNVFIGGIIKYLLILMILIIIGYLIIKKLKIKIEREFIYAMLCTVFSWIIIGLIWKNSLESIEIKINYFVIFFMIAFITIISAISFIPGGIGVAEISAYKIFVLLGLEDEISKLGVIILRMIGIYSLILGIIVYIIIKYLFIRRAK